MTNGKFTTIVGEQFYVIENFDEMQPFFISLASDTDLWMYISSTGGLTCGRKSPDTALFPYYTDDKITESYDHTGSKTIVRVKSQGSKFQVWEPFNDRFSEQYDLKRTIAKSVVGNKLIFTEENKTLGLTFSYQWCSADKYGWIRKSVLTASKDVEVEIIDGLQNVLPAGVNRVTQNTYSTLVDGYKKTELVAGSNLVLFRMEAIMVDRAEPSESLRCNTIYGLGFPEAEYLTSSRQLKAFRKGAEVESEPEAKGVRGAIFTHAKLALEKDETRSWYLVADVEKDAVDVKSILTQSKAANAIELLEEAVQQSTDILHSIVAQNDGVQETADDAVNARHFANVLFNTMRGGFYFNNYTIDTRAFQKHVENFNKTLAEECKDFFATLPVEMQRNELEEALKTKFSSNNKDQLLRLFLEYLPLTFSRRHGDPSRPWNLFNIRVNDEQGNRLISYQGNWRDIFQNWEALSMSYPNYINGIIAKFLNATTVDGYNPYKVTSEGIDWEVIVPEDPWSNIGYWGDHQIIYLEKLLELSYAHNPEAFRALLNQREYAFANVPYRLKKYAEIVSNPKDSIYFEDELHKKIFSILPQYGQDARLVLDKINMPRLVTFTEKILVTLLAKLSNFVPEGGIWMNTLRPEWNDANNALVGYGASMVTLCYMRRFVKFLRDTYAQNTATEYELSNEIMQFFTNANNILVENKKTLERGFDDATRKQFVDVMGLAGENYREQVYKGYSDQKSQLSADQLVAFFDNTLDYIDESIRRNKREDGLYNAYNLLSFSADGISVETLYQMLEGQVAVLTSGLLSAEESADLLDAMRQSDLYRADQQSYMLYPFRQRSEFLDCNCVPTEVKAWADYDNLKKQGIFREDQDGQVHFNSDFRNAACIPQNADTKVFEVYEQVFNHHAFTGRSGTFYKYEGLGSIYWHMVSKLLLAIGETIQRIQTTSEGADVLPRLRNQYREVQRGIGAHKQPAEYGSFPFDPYSHTPSMAGVQQPGMTGQVKEDILNRWFELGLHVENGTIHIMTDMLRKEEFVDGHLKFTYCGTLFDYELADETTPTFIDCETASHIFARDGKVNKIHVLVNIE